MSLLYTFLSLKDLLFRNLFLNFDQIMMAYGSYFFVEGVWFDPTNLRSSGSIEFTTARHASRNSFELLSCLDMFT